MKLCFNFSWVLCAVIKGFPSIGGGGCYAALERPVIDIEAIAVGGCCWENSKLDMVLKDILCKCLGPCFSLHNSHHFYMIFANQTAFHVENGCLPHQALLPLSSMATSSIVASLINGCGRRRQNLSNCQATTLSFDITRSDLPQK